MMKNVVKRKQIWGCFKSFSISLIIDGLFGIFSSLKDMVDAPVKTVHIPKPIKHGVNVISFVEDPY